MTKGTGAQVTIECPVCHLSKPLPDLVRWVTFPDDVESLVKFLEGRLNVIDCGLCQRPIPLLVTLFAFNPLQHAVAVVEPVDSSWEEILPAIRQEFVEEAITRLRDYDELRKLVLKWLFAFTQPTLAIMFSDRFSEVSKEDFVRMVNPLFLVALKLAAEGSIPIVMQTTNPLSDGAKRSAIKALYLSVILDQLRSIFRIVSMKGELTNVLAEVSQRVPHSCITEEVLASTNASCVPPPSPLEDPQGFAAGFRSNLLNAVVHVLGSRRNPHGESWVLYQTTSFRRGAAGRSGG